MLLSICMLAVPVMTEYVTPFLNDTLGEMPIIGPLFQGPPHPATALPADGRVERGLLRGGSGDSHQLRFRHHFDPFDQGATRRPTSPSSP